MATPKGMTKGKTAALKMKATATGVNVGRIVSAAAKAKANAAKNKLATTNGSPKWLADEAARAAIGNRSPLAAESAITATQKRNALRKTTAAAAAKAEAVAPRQLQTAGTVSFSRPITGQKTSGYGINPKPRETSPAPRQLQTARDLMSLMGDQMSSGGRRRKTSSSAP